jgi:hypothetical protein
MFGLASWVILSFVGGLLALSAVYSRQITRWRLVALLGYLASIILSGGAILLSQGWSSPCYTLLPGKYDLIGYLPVPEERIYLFLNTEYGPKTCHIPWDAGKSDQLQKDGEGDGSEINISWGLNGDGEGNGEDDGGVSVGTRLPPKAHADKPQETPFGE